MEVDGASFMHSRTGGEMNLLLHEFSFHVQNDSEYKMQTS